MNMLTPFLHHGMVIVGVPYTVPQLNKTQSGGTPYGASHVVGGEDAGVDADEHEVAVAQGRRLASIALALYKNPHKH